MIHKSLIPSLSFLILLAGCRPILPPDAYGPAGGPLPPGAKPFRGTPEQWNNLKAQGNLVVLSKDQSQKDAAVAEKQVRDAEGTIEAFLLEHDPNTANLLRGKLSQLIDPPSLTDEYAALYNARLQGGVYLHDVILHDADHTKRTFATLAENYKKQIVAGALNAYNSANIHGTYVSIYSHLYDLALKDPRMSDLIARFPSPADVDKIQEISAIQTEINRFGVIKGIPLQPVDVDPRPAPEKEVGYGDGGDRTSTSCATPNPHGIVGSGFNYALKYLTTSVKEQGSRGSCVAFGVSAALESAMARDKGVYLNLSEQDLYYHMKGYWWPAGDGYGDGSDTHAIFDKMTSLGTGYFVPYENQWDYNPSWSRTEDDKARVYTHSCDGYSEACSDTNHQGELECISVLGFSYCGYVNNPGAQTTSQPIRAASDAEVWNHDNPDLSLDYVILALWFKSPVVAGIPVTPSFDAAGGDGYLHYQGSGETNRGGHAVEIVGFIGNESLPAGAPSAAGCGGGPGYFIVKNSWGTCWGDVGYVYVPWQWMHDYAYSMVILNGVSER